MANDSGNIGARDGLRGPRLYWAVAAIWLAVVMAVLDAAIANIALPTISRELGATAADSVWVVNAYQIAVVILLLPLAALGEILGYKRVYAVGLMVFTAASLGCAFAGSLTELAIWRFVQGLGGGAIMAMNGALIRLSYPSASLARGIGWNGMVVAIASAAGPTVAALILSAGSWRWLFAINLPIGLASLAIGFAALPRSEPAARRFDIGSAAVSAIVLLSLFLGTDDIVRGEVSAATIVAIGAGLGLGWWLIRRERHVAQPLVPLDLIARPVLRGSYLASASAFAAQTLAFVVLPFHLHALGFDAITIGLVITAFPVGVSVAAPLAGRLMGRLSAAVLGFAGLALVAAASVALAFEPARVGAVWLALTWGVCGFGFGLFQTPNNRIMLGEAPRARSGAAAGMLAMSRLIGQTAGALLAVFALGTGGAAAATPFLMTAGLAVAAALASLSRRSG